MTVYNTMGIGSFPPRGGASGLSHQPIYLRSVNSDYHRLEFNLSAVDTIDIPLT